MKKEKSVAKALLAVMVAGITLAFSACSGSGTATSSTVSPPSEAASSAAVESTASTAASGGSVDGALKGVKLKVGTSGLFGPFTYYDKDGKTLIGYDIDMIKSLQKVLGFEIDGDIQAMSYSALTASVGQGKLAMAAAALCVTDDR